MTYIIIILLISLSALFSGLTLGLMSLNAQELKRKMSLGDKEAERVYEVRRRGNLLLSTLVVGNVAVNSSLAIFLGSIASGLAAGLISTGLIVIFGEIAPQAIFSRFALTLGAKIAWFVRILIIVLFPICWPIAWVLNKTLGDELATIYSKQELVKIIEEHEEDADSDVKAEEERIVKGALTFSDKKVKDIMTPQPVVFTLEASQKVDQKLIDTLRKAGYSRIPVYEDKPSNIIGILYLIELLDSKSIGKSVGDISDKNLFFVDENKELGIVFEAFLRGNHHMFVVADEFGAFSGVLTLEDVLEEILSSEIMDENDEYKDLRKLAKDKIKKKRKTI